MNYQWKKSLEQQGQKAIGFVEIYETIADEKPIRAIINYFPKLNQF